MRILLYNPDNGVTRNFMPHLWMFLLQALTPAGHEVVLIDGNAQPMDEAGIARFVREQNIGLVGIGAMTRMIAKAYRMADAIRAVGVPVVMGGPHVTEEADEALGRNGGPRHADAVALGEADETWPKIVEDAARGKLKDTYAPVDDFGQERKPSLKEYPAIPWDKINLDQFNLVPKMAKRTLQRISDGWGTFRIIPMESGRGCPYGCEFCTVTGFFGDSIRFRTNESVVNELLLLKARAKSEGGQIAVFFIDDNFAINIKRTKSLLRDIIAAGAQVHWVAQRTLQQVRTWPPGLPIFGLLTPLPATPLYKRLEAAGRLTRPKHWQEFIPFAMAHTPLKMTIEEAHAEVRAGWAHAYSPEAIAHAVDSLQDQPLGYRINIFIARMCFRGIYFPQMDPLSWLKLIYQNRRTISSLVKEGFSTWRGQPARTSDEQAPDSAALAGK